MKGIIFNLLADLARSAGCEDDAWEVALALSEEVNEELAQEDDEEEMLDLLFEAAFQGGADFTFRWLLRSGRPFRDEDWADLADAAPLLRAHDERPSDGFFLGLDPMARRRSNRE
ncbi:MAG TPA: hypothetical protein VH062_05680 [Polyangiaceae bacterium]|jgi:hypothetical protein|nr:hypothetical protein [Polyangiaceae bacterium]